MTWHGPHGSQLYYEDAGRGETVVLLPGWSGSIADLGNLRRELSDGFRVIAADLVREMAEAVPRGEFREAAGAGHDVHLSHHQWLAGAALDWLSSH
jgi:pimeloyl-ACP methyl ester carboxylesterase